MNYTTKKHKTTGRNDEQHEESTAYDGQREGCDGSDRLYFALIRESYRIIEDLIELYKIRVNRRGSVRTRVRTRKALGGGLRG